MFRNSQVIPLWISWCQRLGVGWAWRVPIPTPFYFIPALGRGKCFWVSWQSLFYIHIYVVWVYKNLHNCMFELIKKKASGIYRGIVYLWYSTSTYLHWKRMMQEQQGCWVGESTLVVYSGPEIRPGGLGAWGPGGFCLRSLGSGSEIQAWLSEYQQLFSKYWWSVIVAPIVIRLVNQPMVIVVLKRYFGRGDEVTPTYQFFCR